MAWRSRLAGLDHVEVEPLVVHERDLGERLGQERPHPWHEAVVENDGSRPWPGPHGDDHPPVVDHLVVRGHVVGAPAHLGVERGGAAGRLELGSEVAGVLAGIDLDLALVDRTQGDSPPYSNNVD